MGVSAIRIQDKDSGKRLSVVRSTTDPTKFGLVLVNPDGSKVGSNFIKKPNSSVNDGYLVIWDGTSGRLVKDGGKVPKNTSDLKNDSGFITNAVDDLVNYYLKSEVYTKNEVNSLIADFGGFEVVSSLPTQDIKTNIIYLLGPIGSGADKYEEWIYSNNTWVKIGETSVDLSNYFNKSTDTSDDITEGSTNLFMTSSERTNLGNQSGVNTGDQTASDFDIKDLADSTGKRTSWDGKQDAISDLSTIRSGASAGATAVQPGDLGTAATKNIGTSSGNVPVLDSNGKLDTSVVPDVHSDAVSSVNSKTGAVVLNADDISDSTTTNKFVTSTEKNTWNGKQNALSSQTAYTSKGSATKVPQITTNSLGQVTGITEVTITQPDISGCQLKSNLVTDLTSPDDIHYPSAKAVSDALQNVGGGDMLKSVYDPNNVGADAFDMDNMADGTDNHFVSTAEKTILGNTSGTNTGDQSASDFDIKDLADSTNKRSSWDAKLDSSAIDDTAYGNSWDGKTGKAPSMNAVYDKISSMDTTIGNKANDSDVVKLSGNQTVNGVKTFGSEPVLPSKSSDAGNNATKPATEAQVYKKQDTISDLSTIRDNASAGAGAATTIGGYGNIVTHNTSEFATSTQGGKADTAVQPSSFEFNTASSGATLSISNLSTKFTPNQNFTVSCSTVKEGMQYVLRITSGATAYTMSLGTGITNPFNEDLTLTASKITTVVFLATSSSALELFSIRTEE